MNIKDFTVGQTVVLKKVNNTARHINVNNLDELLVEAVVEKVGQKYLYLEGISYSRMKFGVGHHDIIMDITDYCESYHLYVNREAVEAEQVYNKTLEELKDSIGSKLTQDQIDRMIAIVGE